MRVSVIVATLEGCRFDEIDDPERIERALLAAIATGGFTKLHHHVHRFSPQGVTAAAILSESHIALHSWPEHGILFVLAVSSLEVVGLFMCGWGSNNKYALLSAMRAVNQIISYEVPFILVALVPVVLTGSLRLTDIVAFQSPVWFVLYPVLGQLAFATFLVVPILVARDVGPIDALKESVDLLKRTWGENLAGNVGIGLAFGLLTAAVVLFAVALVVGAAFVAGPELAIVVAVLGALAVALVAVIQAALSGIYSAALYRYAVDGQAPAGFGDGQLQAAFRAK